MVSMIFLLVSGLILLMVLPGDIYNMRICLIFSTQGIAILQDMLIYKEPNIPPMSTLT